LAQFFFYFQFFQKLLPSFKSVKKSK
jgi:hypothetical protein